MKKSIKLFYDWFVANQEFCEYDNAIISKEMDLDLLEFDIMMGLQDSFFSKFIYFNRGSLYDFFDLQGLIIEVSVDYTRLGYGKPTYAWNVVDWNSGNEYKDLNKITWNCLERSRKEAEIEVFKNAFMLLENKLDNGTN